MRQVDFYFDFISPYSYLAATQIVAFSGKYDAEFHWVPVNLPKLIKYSGNTPPATVKNKALYSLRDLKRWADYLNVPFKMIRPGSFDSRPALRIAAALKDQERARFCLGVFTALWSGSVDPGREGWLEEVFKQQSLPGSWISLCNDVLDENSEAAIKAGAFGAPTFVLHGGRSDKKRRPEMFFGIDHMDFLARACRPD
ncbi:MAG: 2-hydroxychromene-2-carboxylate isomerase [Mariprofundaceae bacterium]|nr:2-hydroxychromene-2-carboxylate isomerase [Mariprofundaceae bacterium]